MNLECVGPKDLCLNSEASIPTPGFTPGLDRRRVAPAAKAPDLRASLRTAMATMQASSTVSGPVQAGLHFVGPSSMVKMEARDPGDSVPEEGQKGVGKPPFIIPAESSEELLRWMALHQTRNEYQEVPQRWNVQWQETVPPDVTSSSSPAWGNLQVPPLTLADDIEVYLSTFERVADVCQWPREQWVDRLVPALCGAARQACSSLGSRDRRDYEKVKAAILCRCDIGSEARRQRFRRFCFREAEGPRHACRCLRELCCRWLKPEICSKEQILELLILEQFLNILPEEMKTWVWECRPETCAEAAALAEEFALRQQESERSDLHVTVRMKVEDVAPEEEKPSSAMLWDVPGSQSQPRYLLKESVGRRKPLEPQHELTCVPREEAQPPQEMGTRAASQAADHPPEEDAGGLKMPRDIWGNVGEAISSEWEDRWPGEGGGSSEDELSTQGKGLRKSLVFLPLQTARAKEVLKEPKDTERQVRTFFCGEKPYQCQECGECFRAKQELALHKGTHRGDRPFPCAVCGKRFTRLYHLTTHLRIHSGEKPYHCTECGKRYADASNFYKHQRSHSVDKPYQCTECRKTFGDPASCYKHQKNHRGDRPYICDVCGDCFSKRTDLLAHQRIHDGYPL